MAVLGGWVNHQIARSVLATSGAAGAAFMTAFIEPQVQGILPDGTLPPRSHEALDELLINAPIGKSIVSVKVWRPDGTVIYTSMSKDVIGDHFTSADVEKAASGQIVSEFEDMTSSESAYEQSLQMSLIEVYAPLYRDDTNELLAVGELYEDGEALATELEISRTRTWFVVCLTTLVMLAILYAIVRSGSRTIAAQRAELQKRVVETQHMATQNETLRIAAEQTRMDANEANEELIGRIGLDLHDGPIQLLSLLMLRLSKLRPTGKKEEDESNRMAIQDLTTTVIQELRTLSTGLVLPEISDLTVAQAIRLAVERHENLTGSKVQVDLGRMPRRMPVALKICVYRIVQESLSNSFRHAGGAGQHVEAGLVGERFALKISDRGGGLSEVSAQRGSDPKLGLRGIRNRVQAFGGVVEIRSSQSGTEVDVELPGSEPAASGGQAARLEAAK